MSAHKNGDAKSAPDTDGKTGEPVEEAEDNLSRYSTKDSAPPVNEQERTCVGADPRRPGGSSSGDLEAD